MTLSVICPIYNEEKYIGQFLDSILQQDFPQNNLEILLVDGMSRDRTREIVSEYVSQYPFIRVVDNPERIVPFALNRAIKIAKGDIIIRLDAHAFFPSNYFSVLVDNLVSLHADNVGGVCRTLPVNNSITCVAIANVLNSGFGMGNSHFRVGASRIMEVDTVPFGCFHRELFDRIGFFDEDLIRNQDDEFNGRIIKNGGKIYLLPHLVIDYYARDTISKVYKMFFQYGLFKPLVNKKLGRPATLRQFFPPVFVLGLLFGPFLGFISPYFILIYLAAFILYFFMASFFSLKDSRLLQQVMVQNWVYFVVHFAYGWGYICGIWKLLTRQPFTVNSNR